MVLAVPPSLEELELCKSGIATLLGVAVGDFPSDNATLGQLQTNLRAWRNDLRREDVMTFILMKTMISSCFDIRLNWTRGMACHFG
jgi:hypothetical protein